MTHFDHVEVLMYAFIIWPGLTKTGNCQIRKFDRLKSILTLPSRPESRPVALTLQNLQTKDAKALISFCLKIVNERTEKLDAKEGKKNGQT